MRFTPFDKKLGDLLASDLEGLTDVSEGWYVEYKSELPGPRNLAKTLASFANQYGGWLFLGVDQSPGLLTARAFPGFANERIPQVLESVRNAAKDIVRPQVDYQIRALEGPIDKMGLPSNRSVVVVYVAEGSNTPYIHNDGKIYIRIGDSSSPIPATDKATFDLLYKRGEDRRSYLKALVERSQELSVEEEESQSYLRLYVLSDPYQTLGHWYDGTHSEFAATMSEISLPLDNVYSSTDGFIARQVGHRDPYNRLFTWEFSRQCNSYVTIPMPTLPVLQKSDAFFVNDVDAMWKPYSVGPRFMSRLVSKGLTSSRILNLNILASLILVIISRHRRLVGQVNVKGPFFIKARIENVWRAIPFVDLDAYMAHVERFDFPVVQTSTIMTPAGTALETFIVSPESEHVPSECDKTVDAGAAGTWLAILRALGIPDDLVAQNAKALLGVSYRESGMHRCQLPGEL